MRCLFMRQCFEQNTFHGSINGLLKNQPIEEVLICGSKNIFLTDKTLLVSNKQTQFVVLKYLMDYWIFSQT